jgi:2-dehydropantoate 2-reductase
MHYGIVGFGPVGAVFAACLGKAGHEVTLLLRNPTRAEYFRKSPIRVGGKLHAEWRARRIVTGLDEFLDAGPQVVLLCTKALHSADLVREIRAIGVDEATVFVACQNGIDVEEQIARALGADRALRMVLNLGCNFVKVGDVWVEFCFRHFLSANPGARGLDVRIGAELASAGLAVDVTSEWREQVFRKAILNTALSTACALTRLTMRQAMDDPEIVRMVNEILRESLFVAEAIGFPGLDRSYQEEALAYLSQGGDHKPSMLVDVEAGRITENEFHAGAIFRYAQKHGIDVPVIQTLYYLTKNLEKAVVLNRYVPEGMRGNVA